MAILLIGFLILGIIGAVSYFISAKAYSGLNRSGNAYARAIPYFHFSLCT
jgi:hypothetical protein